MNFGEFSKQSDLHARSHRYLTHDLIPKWLRECPGRLDAHIQSAAYGETPPELFSILLQEFLSKDYHTFLDLGAGAGNLVSQALEAGLSAWGIEQNESLATEGREYLSSQQLPPERLLSGDFLKLDWPSAQVLFTASSRFSEHTREKLAERIQASNSVLLVASLGQSLPLGESWELLRKTSHGIVWNPLEQERTEPLYLWQRAHSGERNSNRIPSDS